ncbi:gamma-glutamyltransferase [Leptolyngbya sp. AN03gr2]|uniref:gamma-glutamyltransferase n=1 Tax=unclassified Leptolyngbya TaxID=2650499 RepID=UPI003D323FE5
MKSFVKRKHLRKAFRWVRFGLLIVSAIVLLDMLLARNVYHPLTYLYKGISVIQCRESFAPSCSSTTSAAVIGTGGMVVTEHHEASKAAVQILQAGGNAIDAAVAAAYALSVSYPCCGNLGGGGFMLIRMANGQTRFLNFRETAPTAATPTMYLDRHGKVIPNLSTQGYLAVGIPGTVKGLDYALTTYGTLSRERVMTSAIALAEQGFVLHPADIAILERHRKTFEKQPNVAKIFLNKGRSYRSGDRLIQTDLARSLKLIAAGGEKVFYQGEIAQKIVQASHQNGGILTTADFASYKLQDTAPLQCQYRNYQILTAPLPGGGTTLCQMLNILEGYLLKQSGFQTPQTLHWMLSAMLFAYADRNAELGDPNFVQNPSERLLSKSYAAEIRSKIPHDRAIDPNQVYRTPSKSEGDHTTHYTIADREGNIVSVTYTLNSLFGAGVIAENTGFFLNNEMDDFTAKPGVANSYGLVQGKANAITPGKRPLSSMTPTIVLENNQPVLATGSPGGSTIPTTVLQIMLNTLEHGKSIEAAVAAPRIHYQGLPNFVLTEAHALPGSTFQQLWEMGYRVIPYGGWGAAESLSFDAQIRRAAHDPRKPTGQAMSEERSTKESLQP